MDTKRSSTPADTNVIHQKLVAKLFQSLPHCATRAHTLCTACATHLHTCRAAARHTTPTRAARPHTRHAAARLVHHSTPKQSTPSRPTMLQPALCFVARAAARSPRHWHRDCCCCCGGRRGAHRGRGRGGAHRHCRAAGQQSLYGGHRRVLGRADRQDLHREVQERRLGHPELCGGRRYAVLSLITMLGHHDRAGDDARPGQPAVCSRDCVHTCGDV
mmetsp:Transcript_22342/g.66583  ORF Transcript_22342/g.66583 Transcript_22342/m.66583 type:complete len:217 (-) Transcript_22342:625-1275(-)